MRYPTKAGLRDGAVRNEGLGSPARLRHASLWHVKLDLVMCGTNPILQKMVQKMIRSTSALVILSVGIFYAVRPTSAADEEPINQLTEQEKLAGWTLLFDGKSFDGWHNFKEHGVRPGWQTQDGVLVCDDPKEAGDIVTIGKYDWFELS
jgi:hypothetical protein